MANRREFDKKTKRDALAADNTVLREALAGIEKAVLKGLTETEGKWHRIKLHPDWTVDGQYLLGTTADNIRDSLRGLADIASSALSNQSTASKVEEIPSGYGEYTPITVSASTAQPAEGQGERGEEQSRRERESEAFDQWWKSSGHADEPAYTLTVETACHRAWQERASRAIPPAPQPQPLEGAVKVSDIIHQIALWADDEGLDLSMGQGEDLARRIRSALSAPAGGAKPADAEEIR